MILLLSSLSAISLVEMNVASKEAEVLRKREKESECDVAIILVAVNRDERQARNRENLTSLYAMALFQLTFNSRHDQQLEVHGLFIFVIIRHFVFSFTVSIPVLHQ